jgi:hypothetical protein
MKAGIEDVFTIAFLLFLLGILGVFGWFFADKIMTGMEGLGMTGIPPELHGQATGAFGFMDGIIAFVLAIMVGGALALAFYSRSRPYLAIISLFIQVFFIIGSYMVKVFWEGFSKTNGEINAVAITNFPLTNLIMTYLPFISFVTLIGIITLYFTKPRTDYAEGV